MARGSIANIIRDIQKTELSSDCVRFFRGQESVKWDLTPSLFRTNKFEKNEYEIYHEIISKCPADFKECTSDFEKMVKMQHYGIPTRLLDITTNLIVALYFACQECNEKENAVIYTFDVPKSELFYFDTEKVTNQVNISQKTNQQNCDDLLCVVPELSNPRIIRQSGAFFLFNQKAINLKKKFNCRIFEISKGKKNELRKQLYNIGVNSSLFFPEIDRVAEEIKNKYKSQK